MTVLTIFLARLLGILCGVIALALLLRRREMIDVVRTMTADAGVMILAGVISLGGGVATILGHNIWTGSVLAVVVTLIGWAMATKGVFLLACPPQVLRQNYSLLRYERHFGLYMAMILVLGIYLVVATL